MKLYSWTKFKTLLDIGCVLVF